MWASTYIHCICPYFSSYWWTNQLLCKYAYVYYYIYTYIPVAPTFLSARMSCKHFHFDFFKLNTIFFYFLLWHFLCFIDALSYSRAHKHTHARTNLYGRLNAIDLIFIDTQCLLKCSHIRTLIWRYSLGRLTIKQKFPNV